MSEEEKYNILPNLIDEISKDYISKDKIRDKIKELEEFPNNQYIHLDYIKQEFKKLLEEN